MKEIVYEYLYMHMNVLWILKKYHVEVAGVN